MAGMSQVQARAAQMPRAADIERELRRMRAAAAAAEGERTGVLKPLLLLGAIGGLLAFILTAGDGQGGLALLKIVGALLG